MKPELPSLAKRGVTEVVLPARQFPRGYRLSVTGAKVVSRPGARVLLLRSAGAAGSVVVTRR